MRKGQVEPVMFLQERTTPYATARLLTEKYSLRDRVVGLYRRAHPREAKMPWVTTRCQTSVLKEEIKKLAHASTIPQKAVVRRKRAHRRLNAAKSMGIERYMTPFEVVPMTPTAFWLPWNDW